MRKKNIQWFYTESILSRLSGVAPDCPDSCAYTKDGGPSDEIWCFSTSTNLTLYPATNLCPETGDTLPGSASVTTLPTTAHFTPSMVSTTTRTEAVMTTQV